MPAKKGKGAADGDNQVFKIIQKSDMEELAAYLEKHPGAASRTNSKQQTPLHIAIQNIDNGCTELLLQAKANTNAQDKEGKTPLHWAVLSQADDLAALLLDAGADPRIPDSEGGTALHWAARLGFLELAECLLGEDVMTLDEEELAELQRVKVNGVELTLAADKQGNTPLHYAAAEAEGSKLAIHLLNNLAAEFQEKCPEKVNIANQEGYSPLHMAVSSGSFEVVQLLLDLGVDAVTLTKDQQNVIHQATIAQEEKVLQLLLEMEDNEVDWPKVLNQTDKQGNTALYYAAEGGKKSIINALLACQERGLDINIKCSGGISAIAAAHRAGNKDAAEIIAKAGGSRSDLADLDKENSDEVVPKRGDYSGRDKGGQVEREKQTPKPPVVRRKKADSKPSCFMQVIIGLVLLTLVSSLLVGVLSSLGVGAGGPPPAPEQ
eukprot:TRINITY_DN55018_c0_g1_i2.p1 TRINITY_DN55018_c0_g1~~TRINITY_DN55018_c0_g1_i2.p1  ORF type:complete len:435 (+),score=55.46 TRINITY_DN55018_c0_g1_i2:32-1336(+)